MQATGQARPDDPRDRRPALQRNTPLRQPAPDRARRGLARAARRSGLLSRRRHLSRGHRVGADDAPRALRERAPRGVRARGRAPRHRRPRRRLLEPEPHRGPRAARREARSQARAGPSPQAPPAEGRSRWSCACARSSAPRVVAEGIETREEFKAVCDSGAHYGQGYLFARPSYPLPKIVWPLEDVAPLASLRPQRRSRRV